MGRFGDSARSNPAGLVERFRQGVRRAKKEKEKEINPNIEGDAFFSFSILLFLLPVMETGVVRGGFVRSANMDERLRVQPDTGTIWTGQGPGGFE